MELFELWTNYYKYETLNDAPKIDNEEGAEALLRFYFKRAPKEIYEYLRTKKKTSSTYKLPNEKIIQHSHPIPNCPK